MKTFVSRDKELKWAIEVAKRNFGATAWKLELESQLNRGDECGDCDGAGEWECSNCDGGGEVTATDSEDYSYEVTCGRCDGSGINYCEYCDGDSQGWSVDECKEFIENNVSKECRENTIYGRCYNDGSVDTEYTVTVPIDNPEYLLEYIHAFNKLASEVGNGHDIHNAGMHIAVLNSDGGSYPYGNEHHIGKLENFKASLTPLLPALLFLGTPNAYTRGLGYRTPKVSDDKYSMIHTSKGIEYRFFDTCYDTPEAIFDNLIIIGRTLEYYSLDKKLTDVKFKGSINFNDTPSTLNDIFSTSTNHLKLLETGLKLIRPTYKTYAQLKQQRSFHVTPSTIREKRQERLEQIRKEYKDYKQRMANGRKALYYRAKFTYYDRHMTSDMQEFVRDYIRGNSAPMITLREFISNHHTNRGGYTLTV